ncbi:MAG: hypothetical protein IPF40_08910 [Actinomycetales bacterium]|uniref:Uncharacterized protein n=1 Tax=Candidatus Phosphoribacter hodrii TaxID=2953743 RepID=A0A934X672_9MICO|nr:hypothetical protein [Candidatus Phosphoribacter hodrii]
MPRTCVAAYIPIANPSQRGGRYLSAAGNQPPGSGQMAETAMSAHTAAAAMA